MPDTDQTQDIEKKMQIVIGNIDPAAASSELQRRLEVAQEEVNRLEEAKAVSQETMRLEVSV